jgi:glutamine amidotransferase
MCELLGINSARKVNCNDLLKEFFTHAKDNPDGWGIARFNGCESAIEKEPISALESVYLQHRLTDTIEEKILLAHIRKASVGVLEYRNTHPFSLRDNSGRNWTLTHNGTIFESEELAEYESLQNGSSDSERILYYLVDRINSAQRSLQRPLTAKERFKIADEVIHVITPNNKVNLMIYDGELFYIHTNHRETLYRSEQNEALIVATKPLNDEKWDEVSPNTLLAYSEGKLKFTGEKHNNEYKKA